MLKVRVVTNAGSQEVIADLFESPMQVLENAQISTTGCTISLRSVPLSHTEINKSFTDLGYTDNDTQILLSAIVKADSASV